MPTSSRFAVAAHILTVMAVKGGDPVRSEDVAARVQTNPAVIRRIVSMLNKAGLTRSQLGLGGGGLLARDSADITLLDVYRAVEEPTLFALPRCAPSEDCMIGRHIHSVLRETTDRAEGALEAELAQTTIGDLAREMKRRLAVGGLRDCTVRDD